MTDFTPHVKDFRVVYVRCGYCEGEQRIFDILSLSNRAENILNELVNGKGWVLEHDVVVCDSCLKIPPYLRGAQFDPAVEYPPVEGEEERKAGSA